MMGLNKSKQQGMSLLTILVIFLVIGAGFTVAVATAPAYYDNYLVRKGLKSLNDPSDPEVLRMMRTSKAKSLMSNFFTLNGVRDVSIEHLEVDRRKEKTLINFNYEVRKNLIGNVDVVMVFKNQIDSTKPDECCDQLTDVKKKSSKTK